MADGMDLQEIEQCREAFKIFDVDGGGTISVDELGQIMKVIGQDIEQDELIDMINEIDEDGNGEIDFQEFLSLMQKKKKEQKMEEQTANAFNIFDFKGDNKFGIEELRQLIKEINMDIPEEQLQEMIDEADADGDGYVNYDEFKRILTANQSYNQ